MIKLTILYGKPTDPAAFDEHYANTHAPLASKIPGLQRYEWGKVNSLDGSEPPYYLIADLWYEDMAAMGAGMGSPEGTAAGADVENFASGGVTVVMSEVTTSVG
jgi:uncharacterized protein (TIGR02118 family)